ncbi:MAG: hypothetical protein IH991_05125 [Planctomycetes bacterium]|nr:hypothetical protein [Planctomycetota bacterium]
MGCIINGDPSDRDSLLAESATRLRRLHIVAHFGGLPKNDAPDSLLTSAEHPARPKAPAEFGLLAGFWKPWFTFHAPEVPSPRPGEDGPRASSAGGRCQPVPPQPGEDGGQTSRAERASCSSHLPLNELAKQRHSKRILPMAVLVNQAAVGKLGKHLIDLAVAERLFNLCF